MSLPDPLSRRHFLRNALAASLAGTGIEAQAAEEASDDVVEVDVVVAGYGAAGACAAIEAHDAGASVIVLEKAAHDTHCSTSRLSSGIYQCPDAAIEPEILKDYITSAYFPNGALLRRDNKLPPPLSAFADTWAEMAPETFEWLCHLDPDFRTASSPLFTTSRFVNLWHGIRPHIHARIATYKQWDGFARTTYKSPKSEAMNGEALYRCLHAGMADRSIPVLYAHPLESLLMEGGAVKGVVARTDKGLRRFRARKGVILATGGFAYNPNLRSALLPASANPFWACTGSPANTGDGITCAMSAGAALVKASAFFDRFCILLPKEKDGVRPGVPLECLGRPHTLLVDNYGRRFASESDLQDIHQHYGYVGKLIDFDDAALTYPYAPSWCIFDETLMSKHSVATLGEGSTVCGVIDWRSNLHALKRGWILTGDTIESLAARIAAHPDNAGRMSAQALHRTVERFNEDAALHLGRDFDRSPSTMSPLDKGPYYAVPVSIDVPHMAAGLKTNADRQVVNWRDEPIEGLFAAGEVAPVSRFMHDRGGHLSECLVFGRHVGRLVAAR